MKLRKFRKVIPCAAIYAFSFPKPYRNCFFKYIIIKKKQQLLDV